MGSEMCIRDRALGVINDCFQSVHRWLDASGLCLNPDKTEAIVIGATAGQRSEPQVDDVTVAGVTVPVTRTVKSLGMTIDNTLSFDDHVRNVCKAAHFHIRALRHNRRCVSVDDVISAGLLQLDTVRHLNIQPQQTTACTERPSAHHHDDQKMRSHQTGVSPSSLAPCYCPHSFQNRTADFQNTYYPSAESHLRPSPSSLLITTTQVH